MYAVIETGGKQYRVSPGQTVEVELLGADPGAEVALERVLLVNTGEQTLVGTPVVPGARVRTTVVREGRGEKIRVFKYKAKKRYRRTMGHRQDYMYLLVTDIEANGESLVPDDERKRYEEQANRQAKRYEDKLLRAYAAVGGRKVSPIQIARTAGETPVNDTENPITRELEADEGEE